MSIRCTPFCRPCDKGYKHHELLIALLNTRDVEQGPSDTIDHDLLEKVINNYKSKGWDINTEIPEINVEFRFPLLHWACVLGFSPTVQTKDSLETCVHRTLMTLPDTCSTKSGRLSVSRFETILPYLRDCLAIGDHRQDTPLHIAAQCLVQNKCFSLYENLFLTMLTEIRKMPWNEKRKCLNAQNGSGDTAFNVLASGCKSLTVMEKLLDAGADSMLVNKLNIGPLDNAERHGLVHIANFLKSLLLKGCGMAQSAAEYRNSSPKEELRQRRSERRSTYYSTVASLAACGDQSISRSVESLKEGRISLSKNSVKENESIESEVVNYDTEDDETLSQSSLNSESLLSHATTDHSPNTFEPSETQVKDEEYEICQCCEVDSGNSVPNAADTKIQDKSESDVRLFDVMKEAGVLPNFTEVITRTKEEHMHRMTTLEKSICEVNGKQTKSIEKEKMLEKEIERKKREIERISSELYEVRRQRGNLNNKRKIMEEESQDLRRKLVCCETLLRTVPKDACS